MSRGTQRARERWRAASRLIRTVRHLQPSQVAWRVRYAVERSRPRPWAPPHRPDDAPVAAAALPEIPRWHTPDLDDDETASVLAEGDAFEHLHRRARLGPPPTQWMLGELRRDRLWAVTLHYHRWVERLAVVAATGATPAKRAEAERCLVVYLGDWLTRCGLDRPGARALAWNAFAIATRLGWWSRAYRSFERCGGLDRHPVLARAWIDSYWQQAAFLQSHLEWDLRANHLLRDAVGLLWAGRFFAHPVARRWLELGTEIAVAQAREQVLPDGSHFERSPMYQIHVFEDLLTAAALTPFTAAAEQLRETCRRMVEPIAWLRCPDEEIPLLNDAARGAVSRPGDALRAAAELGLEVDAAPRRGTRRFEDLGLVVHHDAQWSIFFDVGPVGPDYQPGHAHADTLTVCASFGGRRLLVDPGTHGYDDDSTRRYDRSTAAHNTVGVDGGDSSEVWHIFRVGRRARVGDVGVELRGDGFSAAATHDGYAHLRGRPLHRRTLTLRAGGIRIVDEIDGHGEHRVTGGLLFDPGWTLHPEPHGWVATQGGDRVTVRLSGPGELRSALTTAAHHPGYGREVQAPRLQWHLTGPLPMRVVWTLGT